jgi:hypothetical protein
MEFDMTEEDEAFDEIARKQGMWGGGFQAKRAMAADRDALFEKFEVAQPAQEFVAWAVQGCSKMWRGEFAEIDAKAEAKRIGGTCFAYALYTTPPKREWVGLTDEEREGIAKDYSLIGYKSPFKEIEAKLKGKNT